MLIKRPSFEGNNGVIRGLEFPLHHPGLFSWAPKSLHIVAAAMKLKDACSLEEKL